jgi:uncharacterized protein DUF2750
MINRNINEEQIKAILNLSSQDRYYHSIKQFAGWNELYSIYDDGWVLLNDDEGKRYFPIWPAKEYAELYNEQNKNEYIIKAIDLDNFMENFLEDFEKDKILLGVFITPESKGIIISIKDFKNDMLNELSNYP